MPLVKVVGAKPTLADAAALAQAAAHQRQRVPIVPPEEPPSAPSEESNLPIRLQIPEVVDETPEGVQAMRKRHCAFVVKVHAHALAYLLFAILQWVSLYQIQALVKFVAAHYYLSLVPFVMSYVMLMCLFFFYHLLTQNRKKVLYYVYTAIMLQLATIAVAMPISQSVYSHLILSAIISTIVIPVSIVLAFYRHDYYIYKPNFIFTWTSRCFVVTSMGIIVATSLRSPQFDMVLTMIMSFFMTIYIIICGKAISRAEFIWYDRFGPHVYGSLFYLNYMTLYSMGVLLFMKMQHVAEL